ncbi:MAG: heavy-metal-associated domain-containing protein [Lewinellaceae bacterium]|nr:heavy-metal-associated domain-containing protein [Lewinellaceae bacterium]
MKHLFVILFAGLLLGACSSSKNSTAAMATASFPVRGNCGMCKDRIETTALTTKGVQTASWNDEKETISIFYNPAKTNPDAVAQRIANVGHDTDKFKAPNAVYDKLPGCCKYDREQ